MFTRERQEFWRLGNSETAVLYFVLQKAQYEREMFGTMPRGRYLQLGGETDNP